MNNFTKKNQRNKLLNIVAAGLLIVIIGTACIAIFVRNQQVKEINDSLSMLQNRNRPLSLIENTLETLYSGENYFKEYTLHYYAADWIRYQQQLKLLIACIDSLQTIVSADNIVLQDTKEAKQIIEDRKIQAEKYAYLRKLTDSLLVISTNNNVLQLFQPSQMSFRPYTVNNDFKIDTISISETKTHQTKGLFGAIKGALTGTKNAEKTHSRIVVRSGAQQQLQQEEQHNEDSLLDPYSYVKKSNLEINNYYQTQLKNLLDKQQQTKEQEMKLIGLNHSLLSEIKQILTQIKSVVIGLDQQARTFSSSTIAHSSTVLHYSLLLAILVALLLALVMLWMLRQVYKYQQEILMSHQKAVDEATEKNRFLAYISHEFRNPLTSILGFSRQLKQTPLSDQQTIYLSGVISSSSLMLTSVNDILDLSQEQAGKPMTLVSQPFNAEEVIQQVVASFYLMAKDKNLRLTYQHIGTHYTIIGDEIRLHQIMNNLVSNAIKYTQKGSVSITSTIMGTNGQSAIIISVTDTGIGIAADKLKSIFEEYTRIRTENVSHWILGTGLGLPVTQILLKRMGGTISVNSKEGEGSTFTIQIPCVISAQSGTEATAGKIAAIPDGLHVLVIDDNFFSKILLESMFKNTNTTLESVVNGQDALKRLQEQSFSLILTDMHMPLMTGIEFARLLRSNKNEQISRLPIILITGDITTETVQQVQQAGIDGYLLKPYSQEDLFAMINKVTAKKMDPVQQ